MGGKRRRRAASSRKAAHVAETPGTYRVSRPVNAAADLFPAAAGLSAKEREALGWGLTGKKNNEIATITGKSKRTIEKQMASGLGKLGVDDREAAVAAYHHLHVTQLRTEIALLEQELAAAGKRIAALQRGLRRRP